MKKLAVVLSMMLVGSVSMAATVRDNCGCGLGSMALGNNEATVLSQLAATFLNGICGNQTFGITSGTLDCAPATAVVSNQRVQEFIAGNMDQLAMDIAVGEGDSLNSLADLMDVPASERPALFGKMQQQFETIFPSHDLTSDDVVKNLDKVVNG